MWSGRKRKDAPLSIIDDDSRENEASGRSGHVCNCRNMGRPMLQDAVSAPLDSLAVLLLRCGMAGYATGKVCYWEDALLRAEHAVGPGTGPLIFGRVQALAIAIRHERMKDFVFQGIDCEGISEDEFDLLEIFRAVRSGEEDDIIWHMIARFARSRDVQGISFAVSALVELLRLLSANSRGGMPASRPADSALH
jgi:hypothetical protein